MIETAFVRSVNKIVHIAEIEQGVGDLVCKQNRTRRLWAGGYQVLRETPHYYSICNRCRNRDGLSIAANKLRDAAWERHRRSARTGSKTHLAPPRPRPTSPTPSSEQEGR